MEKSIVKEDSLDGKYVAHELQSISNVQLQRWVKWNIQNTLYSVHFDTRQPFQMQSFPCHFPNPGSQPVSPTSDWQGNPQAGFDHLVHLCHHYQ